MKVVFSAILFCMSFNCIAQQPDTLIKKLDSLSKKTDSAVRQQNNTHPAAYNRSTKLDVPTYLILLGSNLKQSFTKPLHMKSRDWKNLGVGALITGGLAFADKPIQQFALRLRTDNPGTWSTSRYITNFGGPYGVVALGAFGAYGVIFRNEKMKTTTLLATQAYITGTGVATVLKSLSGRTRPSVYAPNTIAEPVFKGPFAKNADGIGNSNSSFPSGHATVAFAAATVFATEYKNKPWVPVVAYSTATLVGLSRISENKHWATDVLVGAALGYLTGRQVVNTYHRYTKIKDTKRAKNTISLNLSYSFRQITPGVIYHFK